MSPNILPREPWRGSQICGYQVETTTWTSRAAYCGDRKADGRYYCDEHHFQVEMEYGQVVMAPGNAIGDTDKPVRLLWEPWEGSTPVEPSSDEMSRYAAVLKSGSDHAP